MFFGIMLIDHFWSQSVYNAGMMTMLFIDTTLFLTAYIAMMAAVSALIKRYEFAEEIIKQVSFLFFFIPLVYRISTVNLRQVIAENIRPIVQVPWPFCWMPNIVYV